MDSDIVYCMLYSISIRLPLYAWFQQLVSEPWLNRCVINWIHFFLQFYFHVYVMYIRYMAPSILLFMLFIILFYFMNEWFGLALIHGRSLLVFFFWDVTRRLIIRLGFPPWFIDLFIFSAIFNWIFYM